MEPATYKGWTIIVRESKGGFAALLVDTKGRKFEGAVICMPTAESAEQFAHKMINWSIRLEEKFHLPANILTVESEIYKGWTIKIQESNGRFSVLLLDAEGKKFEEVVICMPSAKSAEQYAHKVINWSVKLQEQREIAKNSLRILTPKGLTFLT
jgi:hypothetical protein